MDEYISREAAKQRIRDSFPDLAHRCEINAILNSIPAADVRPVVRGHWIEDEYGFVRCSVCGMEWDEPEHPETNFCPNCGADMRSADNG